ncbi:amidohydrolase family protein [Amycolatopsis sp. K13G38]|uniref:Amidohydrolase family protein n=1 Tax=Amycolatopsis acididurans TaxID=2724524 RepID=A0ABX1J0S1_9PSEU|nr:amidohydrolase family protein [Amycolatopsis acididurans]NKQ51877.1 amidohydrolase family protein [Amycolatopsis acididurans]
MSLIDLHTHAIAPDLAAVPGDHRWPTTHPTGPAGAELRVGGRWYRDLDERCWSAEARLRDMDAEGVAVQVLSPVPVTLCHDAPAAGAAEIARCQNDFLAGLAAVAPNRFRALGAVPLQAPDTAIAELRRCLDLGFAGVEIGTRVGDRELTDPLFAPFFDAAEASGAVVFVHPVDETVDPRVTAAGLTFGAGMPGETGIAGAGLVTSDLLVKRPDLRIVLAHGGGSLPCLLPRLDVGARLRGATRPAPTTLARTLFCDSLTYDAPGLLLAAHRFGSDHVVLGTDYPFSARENPPGHVLADVEPDLRAAIGYETARRLLGVS